MQKQLQTIWRQIRPAEEVLSPVESHSTNGSGGVAECFPKTSANLYHQLEIDRLAFLHKAVEERGEKLFRLAR